MTTLTDQVLPPLAWHTVTGLTSTMSYAIQNKTTGNLFIFEAPSAPSLPAEGRKLVPGGIYEFTKQSDAIHVYCGDSGGYISLNELT